MPAIDADAHIDENEHTWECLDKEDARFKPISFDLPDSEPAGPSDGRRHRLWLIDGNARLRRFRSDQATGTTREPRELIDVERTAGSRGRLRWVAQAPLLSMDEVPAVLRFAKDHGACGVMKKGVECGSREAADPYFFPLYEEAAKLDLPICIHQGSGASNQSNTGDFANMSVLNVLSAFRALAAARVPDMFSKLRFGFIEAGASWIPYLIKELGMRGKAAKAEHDFKTGFLAHNRFYVTCDTEDDIGYLLNFGAEDYLMLGTDYSHVDQSAELQAHQVLLDKAQQGDFSSTAAAKIVGDNARRFYGL